jgi:hypothetical protein
MCGSSRNTGVLSTHKNRESCGNDEGSDDPAHNQRPLLTYIHLDGAECLYVTSVRGPREEGPADKLADS